MIHVPFQTQYFLQISVSIPFRKIVKYNWILVGDMLWLEFSQKRTQFFLDMNPFVDTKSVKKDYSPRLMAFQSGR